jgi:hypothetical protein
MTSARRNVGAVAMSVLGTATPLSVDQEGAEQDQATCRLGAKAPSRTDCASALRTQPPGREYDNAPMRQAHAGPAGAQDRR